MPNPIRAKLITAAVCAALTLAAPARASTEKVLHSFFGSPNDGATPIAGLVASGGTLYGTTSDGGGSGCGGQGCGTVFKISPDGTSFAVLHSFAGSSNDGAHPTAGLVADSNGNLYGTTEEGGGTGCGGGGCGTVFKISPDGTSFAVLHSFTLSDGAGPLGLIISGGNLYGTALGGPSPCLGDGGCGVVFELSPDGTSFAVLHSFTGSDGAFPSAGLVAGSNGNLYGVTFQGGTSGCNGIGGCGVAFRLLPDGTSFKVLHSFSGPPNDGANPGAGLIVSGGSLYGTTSTGGASNVGVVFKLSPDGTSYTVLRSFIGSGGADPRAGLIADGKGNLFGTTAFGGALDAGVAFRLSPGGMYRVLYSFCGKPGCSDGKRPQDLIAGSDGNLYGTTAVGGGSGCGGIGCGVVFKLQGTGFGP
jgi:uncharacterized repeat protein (TIGR03803 family)